MGVLGISLCLGKSVKMHKSDDRCYDKSLVAMLTLSKLNYLIEFDICYNNMYGFTY